jgi:hypothetical protein
MLFLKIIGLTLWTWYAWSMGQIRAEGLNAFGTLVAMSFFLAAPLLYLLPTHEAWKRRQPNLTSIALVNIFLGWSLIGWVVSLAWACKDVPSAQPDSVPAASEWLRSRETAPSQPLTPAIPPTSHATPVGVSIADELRKLADLKAQGILTEDEFLAQKAKLLR